MVITSNLLTMLLRERHEKDLFISECKTGSSATGCLRLDAWAMKKSWAHPLSIGYEIKISRQDFLNDQKWRGYLPYCNEFYFVCPPKLILPEELPDDTGLIYASSTGTKLFTKKKCKYRPVVIPEDFYKYILMARTKICHTYGEDVSTSAEYWKNWLDTRNEEKELGHRVSIRIQNLVKNKIKNAENENRKLRETNENLQEVKDILVSLNIDPTKWFSTWTAENRIKDKLSGVDEKYKKFIVRIQNSLETLLAEVKKRP